MSRLVQEFISRRFAELLKEVAGLPTDAPWALSGPPRSLVTGRPYRGITGVMCHLFSATRQFANPTFASLKQVVEAGGRVRREEIARGWTPVTIWKPLKWQPNNGAEKSCLLPSSFSKAWCIEQTTLEIPILPPEPHTDFDVAVERITQQMRHPVEIRTGGDKAFYRPSKDFIQLRDDEHSPSGVARVLDLIHELSHATGAAHRLNRRTIRELGAFGSADYAEEEAIASLASLLVFSRISADLSLIQASAKHCLSWWPSVSADSRAIFRICNQAQRSADYLLGECGEEASEAR